MLAGPYVFKVGWQDYQLKTGDLNNDGREDWFTLNAMNSLMSLYLSKAGADGAPPDEAFELQEIVMEKLIQSAIVGDVTGDGRNDLLLCGNPEKLTVMIQDENGNLLPPNERDPECNVALLDAGRESGPLLYAFKDNRITIYKVEGQALFTEVAEYYGASTPRGEPQWLDMDGDGIEDVIFLDLTKPDMIVMRRRGADGLLMPEQSFKIGNNVSLTGLTNWGGQSALLAIDSNTRVFKVMLYKAKDELTAKSVARLGSPLSLGFDKESQSSSVFMELGDFNADGRQDVLLVAPGAGNLRIFYAAPTVFNARKFPAFEGIIKARHIPPAPGRATPLIAVVSKSEKVLGFSVCHPDNRIDFPQPAVFDIEPINFEIADVDGNGRPDFFFLGKDGDGRAQLRLYRNPALPQLDHDNYVVIDLAAQAAPPPSAESGGARENPFAAPASGTPADPAKPAALPTDIRILDLNQDTRPDLALFFDFEKPRLFLQSSEGAFAPATLSKSVAEGIVANMTAANTFSERLPQSDHRWTFLARANFLRAFSLDKENAPVIFQQFNGRNNRSTIDRAAILLSDKGREAIVALLDSYNKALTLYHFDADEWKVARHIDLDDSNWIDMRAGDLNGDGRDDLMLLGADRLQIFLANEAPMEMDTVFTMKSDIPDGYFALVEALPLGLGEGSKKAGQNILLLENTERLLEIHDIQGDGPEMARLARFKVFSGEEETRAESGARKFLPAEPRNIKSADVNGDGKPDLLALVHDRVIVYLGK